MHFSTLFLSPLAAIFLFSVSAVVSLPVESAPSPRAASNNHPLTLGVGHSAGPQFKEVFAGHFDMASRHLATGPFGSRVHNAMSGGSMWDAETGAVVADILPFADDGLSSTAGPFFPAAVIPLVWTADGHYAVFSTVGVRGGSDHRSWEYAHVETDSPTYAWMNDQFFLLRVNSSALPRLTFTMYQETS
ncbi:hypothetical protein GSI_00076 [Ganoderma sinense ZZ0214-1]|uniref:Glycoside hydrolase family 43 protein n=1 Tax=Ganoderma sinense ZZ0214-1 TaxID=1077348 RepID=A0A2G8SS36_9APHY|nr:hypothetical protein GSI_00076 [Ganoderma sinense ZZ0214-1]